MGEFEPNMTPGDEQYLNGIDRQLQLIEGCDNEIVTQYLECLDRLDDLNLSPLSLNLVRLLIKFSKEDIEKFNMLLETLASRCDDNPEFEKTLKAMEVIYRKKNHD